MDTFNVEQCAAFLHVDRTTILKLAGDGALPGAKIGREWVFLKDDVVDFFRAEVRRQQQERTERKQAASDLTIAVSATRSAPVSLVRKSRGRRAPSYLSSM